MNWFFQNQSKPNFIMAACCFARRRNFRHHASWFRRPLWKRRRNQNKRELRPWPSERIFCLYDELPKLRPTFNFNEKVLKCHRTTYILHFPILMIFNVLCVWSRNMSEANINFLSCQNKIDHIMVMGCVTNSETFRFKINKHFQNKHENFVKKWLLKK